MFFLGYISLCRYSNIYVISEILLSVIYSHIPLCFRHPGKFFSVDLPYDLLEFTISIVLCWSNTLIIDIIDTSYIIVLFWSWTCVSNWCLPLYFSKDVNQYWNNCSLICFKKKMKVCWRRYMFILHVRSFMIGKYHLTRYLDASHLVLNPYNMYFSASAIWREVWGSRGKV